MPPTRRGQTRGRSRSAQPSAGGAESGGRYGEPDLIDINIEELGAVDEPINILLYGPSGTGKTVLASGAPNATFLTTEKGVIAAKQTGNKPKVIRAVDWRTTLSGIKWAEANLAKGQWLIVDSATKMQQMMLTWLLESQAEQNSRRDVDLPELQDHQKWQNMFRRFVDRIYDMPCNTITIATSMIRVDREGDDEVLPELMGGDRWQQLAHYMCSQAGIVMYYALTKEKDENKNKRRYLVCQPSPPYAAKDRYNVLGNGQYVEHEDYQAMAEFISWIEEEDSAAA